jgi:hypothetical protein
MMYLEVHALAGANLYWRCVEAQGSSNATEAQRNFLVPSHQDGRPDHYALEGGLRTRTKLEVISQ